MCYYNGAVNRKAAESLNRRNGGTGRRPGLKIPWELIPYRFDPGFRHQYIAEWSSLVARRAHNPKVVWFKSCLRNQNKAPQERCFFFFSKGYEADERGSLGERGKTIEYRFFEVIPHKARS